MISLVCEEFKCLPNAAIQALQEDEGFLIYKILELRAYSRAKETYDNTPMEKRPRNAMMSKVSEIVFELAKAKIAEHNETNG